MRLVLMTSSGCVRKEAIAPASPVERMRMEEVSSTVIVLGIFNYIQTWLQSKVISTN